MFQKLSAKAHSCHDFRLLLQRPSVPDRLTAPPRAPPHPRLPPVVHNGQSFSRGPGNAETVSQLGKNKSADVYDRFERVPQEVGPYCCCERFRRISFAFSRQKNAKSWFVTSREIVFSFVFCFLIAILGIKSRIFLFSTNETWLSLSKEACFCYPIAFLWNCNLQFVVCLLLHVTSIMRLHLFVRFLIEWDRSSGSKYLVFKICFFYKLGEKSCDNLSFQSWSL